MTWLKAHGIRISALAAGCFLMLWAYGCTPRVESLIEPGKKVNAQELKIEFDTLVSVFEMRNLDLEQQNRLRSLLTENALLMAQSGTFNPFGFLSGLAALYGVGSVAKDTKNVVKRIKTASSYK